MDFIKRHKWLLLVVGSVILIAGIIALRGGGKKEAPAENEPQAALSFYQNLFSSIGGENTPDPSKVPTFEVERVNFIKKVQVKQTVCVGEDFEVKVTARDPEGRDKDLIYKVGTKVGNPVIYRYLAEGSHELVVTVRDFKRIDTQTVTVKAIKCADRPIVYLRAGLHPMRPEEGEFEVLKAEGLSGKCTYVWDFGDGSSKTTSVGYATHNYFAREQTRFHSTFIVSVTVSDEKGQSATAKASIDFPNTQWISAQMGNASIPMSYNRFPVKRGDGYVVDVNMKNIYREQISFGEATVEYVPCDTSLQTESREYGAGALLSQTVLAPNETASATLTIARSIMPKSTCNVTVRLKGATQSGKQLATNMYLTIPATGEDLKKKGVVIDDPELDRKVQKAKKILGKDFVTTDELRTLEKEGKL